CPSVSPIIESGELYAASLRGGDAIAIDVGVFPERGEAAVVVARFVAVALFLADLSEEVQAANVLDGREATLRTVVDDAFELRRRVGRLSRRKVRRSEIERQLDAAGGAGAEHRLDLFELANRRRGVAAIERDARRGRVQVALEHARRQARLLLQIVERLAGLRLAAEARVGDGGERS